MISGWLRGLQEMTGAHVMTPHRAEYCTLLFASTARMLRDTFFQVGFLINVFPLGAFYCFHKCLGFFPCKIELKEEKEEKQWRGRFSPKLRA